MTEKIIIFILEWWSEISFIKQLIAYRYWFSEDEYIKSPILYQKWKLNVLMLDFSWKSGVYGSGGWWDGIFTSAKNPHIFSIPNLIKTHLSHIKNNSEIIYIWWTDCNNQNLKQNNFINEINKLPNKWEIKIFFSEPVIEDVFVCGIDNKFEQNTWIKINSKELNIYTKNRTTKKMLPNEIKNILKDKIFSQRLTQNDIWEYFWKYWNIECMKLSNSNFAKFIDYLDIILWL